MENVCAIPHQATINGQMAPAILDVQQVPPTQGGLEIAILANVCIHLTFPIAQPRRDLVIPWVLQATAHVFRCVPLLTMQPWRKWNALKIAILMGQANINLMEELLDLVRIYVLPPMWKTSSIENVCCSVHQDTIFNCRIGRLIPHASYTVWPGGSTWIYNNVYRPVQTGTSSR